MGGVDDSLPVWLRSPAFGGGGGEPSRVEESLEEAARQLSAPSRSFLLELARQCHQRRRAIRFLRLPSLNGDLVVLVDGKVALQFDELTEIIVVSNGNGNAGEFGDWLPTDDRYADATRRMDELLDHQDS